MTSVQHQFNIDFKSKCVLDNIHKYMTHEKFFRNSESYSTTLSIFQNARIQNI